MKLNLSSNKISHIEAITARGRLDRTMQGQLAQMMVYRETLLFLKYPKRYVIKLNQANRAQEGMDPFDITLPDELVGVVNVELEKSRDRWGSGVSKISESKITIDILMTKMLISEIDELFKKREGYQRYRKTHFLQMDGIIQQAAQREFPPKLTQAVEKYKLNREVLIRYLLLSAHLPVGMSDGQIMKPSFIEGIINIKSEAFELFIKEAEEFIQKRDSLDFIRQYNDTDLLSYKIRQAMNGTPIEEEDFSARDLKREIKREFKENT